MLDEPDTPNGTPGTLYTTSSTVTLADMLTDAPSPFINICVQVLWTTTAAAATNRYTYNPNTDAASTTIYAAGVDWDFATGGVAAA